MVLIVKKRDGMFTSRDPLSWRNNFVGDNERSKKETKTEEETGRHQKMDRIWVWRFSEGSGRQGKMERYCCNYICGGYPDDRQGYGTEVIL